MGNVIKPKLFGVPSSVKVSSYKYKEKIIDPFNNPISIDYSDKAIKSSYQYMPSDPSVIGIDPKAALAATATAVNTAVSLVKGVISFGEALGDTAAIIVGAVVTPRAFMSDIGSFLNSKITGKKWNGFSNTRALWVDNIMPYVGENNTEYLFDTIYYNTKFGQLMNENAINACKKDGAVCKVAEGVGYYTGVVALAAATAGASTAVTIPTSVAHGAVAATAAIGRNAQSGYNKLSDEEKQSGGALAKTLAVSTGMALVEGASYAAGVEVGTRAGTAVAGRLGDGLISDVVKAGVQGTIKSTRPIINEGIESAAYGTDYDFKKVGIQVAATYGAEAVGAIVENGVINSVVHHHYQYNNQFSGTANGPNLSDIVYQADPGAAALYETEIVYAATEWSEGVAANSVEQTAEAISEAVADSSTEEAFKQTAANISDVDVDGLLNVA